MQDIRARARAIRLAIFDVDGVLTDGTLSFTGAGEEVKSFNVLDGHGMRLLRAGGVELAIITSRASRAVAQRMAQLGVGLVRMGAEDKLAAFDELLARAGFAAAEASFLGDDLQDVPVMRRCGLAAAVPNAPAAVRRHAHYVTRARGGGGAAREFCELILHAQGALRARLAAFGA
ncbi:MAG: HAD hydrolase family protein [Burkholderiales bacterium]|nr:HAD hydrolase family protein [Burkholderiales bacterium]